MAKFYNDLVKDLKKKGFKGILEISMSKYLKNQKILRRWGRKKTIFRASATRAKNQNQLGHANTHSVAVYLQLALMDCFDDFE